MLRRWPAANGNNMKEKFNQKFKNNSDLILTVALAIGILAVINFFSYNFFLRRDLTAAGLYSISPATKQVIRNLPDVVQVKVYFSRDLPSQFLPVRQSLTDLLDEYQSYSHNFKVEYIDPKDGAEAEAVGIPKLQFNDVRQDKLEVVNGYMGLVINYHDKSEVIPAVQDIANFEYELTSRIKKITGSLPAVGLVSGHGSPDPSYQLAAARQELSKLYPIETVSADKIPDQIKTLLIIAPKDNFSDAELKSLDKFLIKGNSLVVFVDGVSVGQDLQAAPNKTNLIDQLAKYGVKVNRNLVLDTSAGLASFSQGLVTFSLAYPYWPKIVNKNFDQTSPLVSGLDGVVLPWASSLEVDQKQLAPDAQVTYLAKSSRQAWLSDNSFPLNPSQRFTPGAFNQYNLALVLAGKITSAYSAETTDRGRLYVVGDGDFIQDNFWRGNPVNLVLAQNLLDGASLDAGLVGIRTKNVGNHSLDTAGVNKELVRYLNIFGLTAVVLIFGLVRYYLRKKTKMIEI